LCMNDFAEDESSNPPICPLCSGEKLWYEFVSAWDEDGNEIVDGEWICPECDPPEPYVPEL